MPRGSKRGISVENIGGARTPLSNSKQMEERIKSKKVKKSTACASVPKESKEKGKIAP